MSDLDDINDVIEALPDSAFVEDVLAGDFEGIHFGTHTPRFGTHAPDFGVNTSVDGLDAQPENADAATPDEDEEDMLDPEVAFRDIDMLLTDDIDFGDDIPGDIEINDEHNPSARVIGMDLGTHEPDFGTHAPDFGTIGSVDEIYTGPNMLDLLNEASSGPEYGVGTPDEEEPEFGTHEPDTGTIGEEDDNDEEDMLDPEVAFRDIDMLLTDDIDYGDDIPGNIEINDEHDPSARVIGSVDEIYTGPSMIDLLNEASVGPEYGVGTPDEEEPEFGTHDPDTGTGEDYGGAGLDEPLYAEDDDEVDVSLHQEMIGQEMLALAEVSHELGIEGGETVEFNYNLENQRADIIGVDEYLQHATSYNEYEINRTAKGTPMLSRRVAPMEQREWQLDLGPASAPAGEQLTFYSQPQFHFRTEKVMATDSVGGTGTRILSVQVGHRLQRPAGGGQGALTAFFAQTALGNGQLWDTCQPALQISMTVSFVQACTFDCTIFGSAVI